MEGWPTICPSLRSDHVNTSKSLVRTSVDRHPEEKEEPTQWRNSLGEHPEGRSGVTLSPEQRENVGNVKLEDEKLEDI